MLLICKPTSSLLLEESLFGAWVALLGCNGLKEEQLLFFLPGGGTVDVLCQLHSRQGGKVLPPCLPLLRIPVSLDNFVVDLFVPLDWPAEVEVI